MGIEKETIDIEAPSSNTAEKPVTLEPMKDVVEGLVEKYPDAFEKSIDENGREVYEVRTLPKFTDYGRYSRVIFTPEGVLIAGGIAGDPGDRFMQASLFRSTAELNGAAFAKLIRDSTEFSESSIGVKHAESVKIPQIGEGKGSFYAELIDPFHISERPLIQMYTQGAQKHFESPES